jgi:hypothetical protein
MSQYTNNMFLHNLRVGVQMVENGMPAEAVSIIFEREGIRAPHQLLSALAEPGVVESLSSKPFTHARAQQHIAAHECMKRNLIKVPELHELDEDLEEALWVED